MGTEREVVGANAVDIRWTRPPQTPRDGQPRSLNNSFVWLQYGNSTPAVRQALEGRNNEKQPAATVSRYSGNAALQAAAAAGAAVGKVSTCRCDGEPTYARLPVPSHYFAVIYFIDVARHSASRYGVGCIHSAVHAASRRLYRPGSRRCIAFLPPAMVCISSGE